LKLQFANYHSNIKDLSMNKDQTAQTTDDRFIDNTGAPRAGNAAGNQTKPQLGLRRTIGPEPQTPTATEVHTQMPTMLTDPDSFAQGD
jgi:hypothetical protein